MIEVQHLTKSYGGFTAIDGVTFEVEKGEIVGFLGPNGAGKTTTMRILTGYHPATKGTAVMAGHDVHKNPLAVKQSVGYLPENVPLYLEMTVRKYLLYVSEIKGLSKADRAREIGRVIERCGLEQMSKRIIRNLSKGYRQRVGLAQALLGDPPVLILDEPTVGLDPKQIVSIRQTIKDLANDHTVLLSTHILPEVSMVCQRVLILHHGRIVAENTVNGFEGNHSIELEVDGPREKVERIATAISGALSIRHTSDNRYRLETSQDIFDTAALTRELVNADLMVRKVVTLEKSLEDVFMDVIAQDEEVAS